MICNTCKKDSGNYGICTSCSRAMIDESLSRICRKKVKLEYIKK